MAGIARLVCAEAATRTAVLERVNSWAATQELRPALAALVAIGRCGEPENVEALISLRHAPGLLPALRVYLPLALAQVRDPDVRAGLGGGWVFGVMDAFVDRPVAEPGVVEALREWFIELASLRVRTQDESSTLGMLARVLGYVAQTDGDLRAMLLTMVQGDASPLPRAGTPARAAFEALALSAASPEVEAYLVRTAGGVDSEEDLDIVLRVLLDGGTASALRAVAAMLDVPGLPQGRRQVIVRRLGDFPGELADVRGSVLEILERAERLGRETPAELDAALSLAVRVYVSVPAADDGARRIVARVVASWLASARPDAGRAAITLRRLRVPKERVWFAELFESLAGRDLPAASIHAVAAAADGFTVDVSARAQQRSAVLGLATRLPQEQRSELEGALVTLLR